MKLSKIEENHQADKLRSHHQTTENLLVLEKMVPLLQRKLDEVGDKQQSAQHLADQSQRITKRLLDENLILKEQLKQKRSDEDRLSIGHEPREAEVQSLKEIINMQRSGLQMAEQKIRQSESVQTDHTENKLLRESYQFVQRLQTSQKRYRLGLEGQSELARRTPNLCRTCSPNLEVFQPAAAVDSQELLPLSKVASAVETRPTACTKQRPFT